MRAVGLVLVLVAISCAPSAPPTMHTEYQYSLARLPDSVGPGDSIQLEWKATGRDVPGTRPTEAVARVCVALAGPYEDVAGAKASARDPRTCPVTVPGTVASTGTVEVDLLLGTPALQTLVVPTTLAPGFYNVWQVLVYGRTGNGNSTSGAGIIRVTARQP